MFTCLCYTFGTKPFRQMYKTRSLNIHSVCRGNSFLLESKRGKIVHTACHNDSSSMNLMFLTPYIKLIGHSQETCVLWINCSQILLRRKLFYFCFAVLPVSYWQLDRAWNKKQFLWIIAVSLSRSLIKLKDSMWKNKEIGSSWISWLETVEV